MDLGDRSATFRIFRGDHQPAFRGTSRKGWTWSATDSDASGVQSARMEHYRLRKYRAPEVWARVREAYVAGEPGPSVARRFDVGLANLRKRALREGWTRNRVAQQAVRDGLAAGLAPPLAGGAGADPLAAIEETTVDDGVSRAVHRAAWLLAEGRGGEALSLIRAVEALVRLTGCDGEAARELERMRVMARVGRPRRR